MIRACIVLLTGAAACASVEPTPLVSVRLVATTPAEIEKAHETIRSLAASGSRPLCIDLVLKGEETSGGGSWRPIAEERQVIDALDRGGYQALDVHNTNGDPTAQFGALKVRRYLSFPVEVCDLGPDVVPRASVLLWREQIPHGWSFSNSWTLHCPTSERDRVETVLRAAAVPVLHWAKRPTFVTSPTKKKRK